jgi:lipopolysaccharide heptosyltransferase III
MNEGGRIELPARPRILVVSLRRLGDVLLTTPLIRSLRAAWPDATIDALVFADTAGILEGNPDLNGVIVMPVQRGGARGLALAARLWRAYDLAISTQTGDRPTFFAATAGRLRIAPVEDTFNGRLKRAWLHRSIPFARKAHRVEQILRLADAAGIARVPQLVGPQPRAFDGMLARDFAVIHAAPMFRYKQWTAQGWRAVAAALAARGIAVVATGGPAEAERRYLDEVWAGADVTRVDGRLDWPQLAGLLAKMRVYVGPDTSVTHLAAASGRPTVAIYGPTDPRLWGPWPTGGMATDWDAAGSVQQHGNVWLVQNPLPCMPCQLEGCERRLDSYSACLDELAPPRVIAAVEQALGSIGF